MGSFATVQRASAAIGQASGLKLVLRISKHTVRQPWAALIASPLLFTSSSTCGETSFHSLVHFWQVSSADSSAAEKWGSAHSSLFGGHICQR